MAKKLGIDVSREEMMAFVHVKENTQKAQTEKANQTVKEALGDHDLDQVAGGGADGGGCSNLSDAFTYNTDDFNP